jgi:Transposase DDE domain
VRSAITTRQIDRDDRSGSGHGLVTQLPIGRFRGVRTITCPANKTQPFDFGTTVEFDPEDCDRCPLRDQCTDASLGHGRTVSIADNEQFEEIQRHLSLAAAAARAAAAKPRRCAGLAILRNAA